ncbi:hypothetical protein [Pantoea sp. Cy-639]|nr:hypothetical protein [Pantoea sp. Cy-639]
MFNAFDTEGVFRLWRILEADHPRGMEGGGLVVGFLVRNGL